MKGRAALRRFAGLGWSERLLLAEAGVSLALASLAIRILPFRRVARIASGFGGRGAGRGSPLSAARAVEAAARRAPWKAVCFQQGLALHLMLRRRGLPSVLHYGVAQRPSGKLDAHVWISVSGEIVLGAAGLDGHVPLAAFPGEED